MAMALVACPYAITIVSGVPVMPRTATVMGHSTMYEIAMMRHARDSDFGRSGTGSGAVEVEMVELRSHRQRPAVILDNDRIRRLAAVDRSDDDIVAYERTVDPVETRGYTVDPVETRGTTEDGADDHDNFNTASPLTPTFVVDTPTNAVEGSSFHRRAHDDPVDDDDHRVDAVEDATTYVHDNVITLERDTDLVDDNTANSSDDTKDSGIEKKDLEDSLDGCCPICLDPLDGPCVDDVHGRSSLVDNDHHHHLSTLSDSTNKPHSLRECGHAFHRYVSNGELITTLFVLTLTH